MRAPVFEGAFSFILGWFCDSCVKLESNQTTKWGIEMKLILASSSPRRQELLRNLQLQFEVQVSQADETVDPALSPEEVVQELAKRKAKAVALNQDQALVIGADTVVVLDGQILGKPRDPSDAISMLTRLQGRSHFVYSGIALIEVKKGNITRELTSFAKTEVWMRSMSPEKIKWYVDTKEPLDKAGAYGIQGFGACLIEKINGCYFNVVGMSLSLLDQMMEQMGYPLFSESQIQI